MISIEVPETRLYNEADNSIITVKPTVLQLEHSLISVKKWEQKWGKPFLAKGGTKQEPKSMEEVIDYIRCMTINSPDPNTYLALTDHMIEEIVNYIQKPMTATWFSNNDTAGAARSRNETITAEIIYYWMIELGIPVEFQKWHLNQLLTLIRVISIKRSPKKKMSRSDTLQKYNSINAKRRAASHSKG